MKKTLIALLVLCLAISFAGCASLPDPKADVEAYIQSIPNMDRAEIQDQYDTFAADVAALGDTTGHEETIKSVFQEFLAAYRYEVGEITVNKKDKTAVANATISVLDGEALQTVFENNLSMWFLALPDGSPAANDDNVFVGEVLRIMSESIAQTKTESPMEPVPGQIQLAYNDETGKWDIIDDGGLSAIQF